MDRLTEIVNEFNRYRDDEAAVAMKKYMKDNFEFLGIKSPKRKELERVFFKSLTNEDTINKVWVLQLWSYECREFQYLAIDYLINRKKHLKKEHMDLIQILITTKSWWDTVDLLASNLVGELCKKYPDLVEEYIIKWTVEDNMWLRRAAILYQLKYKENTDTKILEYTIFENKMDKDFFIRKAIGWALREYSKKDKVWVKDFLNINKLDNLSVREARKYL